MAFSLKMVFAIICLVLQFIVFLFVLVATPIDAFRAPGGRWCYSMWGLKPCGAHGVQYRGMPYKGFPCAGVRDLMSTAGAFAIFSIFLTLVALILTVVNVVGVLKTANLITLIICIVAFVTILISWACMAGAKNRGCMGGQLIDYAGAFGLMVTAWILQLIVCVLLFFA